MTAYPMPQSFLRAHSCGLRSKPFVPFVVSSFLQSPSVNAELSTIAFPARTIPASTGGRQLMHEALGDLGAGAQRRLGGRSFLVTGTWFRFSIRASAKRAFVLFAVSFAVC
jgi:hypothetical protein